MTAPLETHCDHCNQVRPLFRYRLNHGLHLAGGAFVCNWCTREEQPNLCARCWSTEREEADPTLVRETALWAEICDVNERVAGEGASAC